MNQPSCAVRTGFLEADAPLNLSKWCELYEAVMRKYILGVWGCLGRFWVRFHARLPIPTCASMLGFQDPLVEVDKGRNVGMRQMEYTFTQRAVGGTPYPMPTEP